MTQDTSIHNPAPYVAFQGDDRIAAGTLGEVAVAARRAEVESPRGAVLVFDASTGRIVDLDLRGEEADILARSAPQSPPAGARGRPKLGVTAREVTLLPRQWEWLASQPGGASAALRRLVDAARRVSEPADRRRQAREAAYRFMSAMAGDLPGFEEASRALFADDAAALRSHMAPWPDAIADQVLRYLDCAVMEG